MKLTHLMAPQAGEWNVSDALIATLAGLGARFAFGLIGGAIVPFYEALTRSRVQFVNFRHENGAAYAAIEASLVDDTPVIVFVTTGPGLSNALTGVLAARWEGAKLLLVSGHSGSARRGRYPLQESNDHTLAAELYRPGALFDHAVALEHEDELPRLLRTLRRGFASRRGFVAHVALPLTVQTRRVAMPANTRIHAPLAPDDATMTDVLTRLREPFGLWLGHGARWASAAIRTLLERTGAPVITTARGKGIIPEHDPRLLGISGAVGADDDLAARVSATGIRRLLVLGSRLGEFSSAFDRSLIPEGGLIHVDLDINVPGSAFPHVETLAIQAEIGTFVNDLLARLEPGARPLAVEPRAAIAQLSPRDPTCRVRPAYLMQCLQARVIDGSDGVIMAESGNSFAWTTRLLRMPEPGRYRQAGLFCPMGQISAGAVGTALASGRRVVAVVGDGALLMQNEISTAVQLGLDVAWIVLNDARYGMVHQGLRARGHELPAMGIPPCDFVMLAEALGAAGLRVDHEHELPAALDWAMSLRGPVLLDIATDTSETAPFAGRIRSIDEQAGASRP